LAGQGIPRLGGTFQSMTEFTEFVPGLICEVLADQVFSPMPYLKLTVCVLTFAATGKGSSFFLQESSDAQHKLNFKKVFTVILIFYFKVEEVL
jgi:hypothetical protein